MRLSVNLDELERGLTHFTEGYADGRFPRFMFPPSQTLPTAAVDMKAVLRRTLISLLSIIACFAASIPLFLTATVVTILSHYRHQIHHIQWRLLKLLYGIALDIFFGRYPPMQYVFTTLVYGVLGFVWLLLLRWAWNRRAARLNCEASLPQQALVVDGGVWPPQLNVPDEEQVSRLDSHHAASCRHGQDGEGTY